MDMSRFLRRWSAWLGLVLACLSWSATLATEHQRGRSGETERRRVETQRTGRGAGGAAREPNRRRTDTVATEASGQEGREGKAEGRAEGARAPEAERQANRRERLDANRAQGKAGEAQTRERLGESVAGEQVTFKSNDGTRRARADFVTKDRTVVETKTGDARLSEGQAQVKADIDGGRTVTPVGKNAEKAGLKPGEPTTMKCCEVDRVKEGS